METLPHTPPAEGRSFFHVVSLNFKFCPSLPRLLRRRQSTCGEGEEKRVVLLSSYVASSSRTLSFHSCGSREMSLPTQKGDFQRQLTRFPLFHLSPQVSFMRPFTSKARKTFLPPNYAALERRFLRQKNLISLSARFLSGAVRIRRGEGRTYTQYT